MRKAFCIPPIALIGLVTWLLTYPSANDPQNIRYVLWKAGVYRMDPDVATQTMIGDASRGKLVVGKTKQQLLDRIGYLTAPADASAYLSACYQQSFWRDRDVLFIRSSPWMVVLTGDKSTSLVLVKGCQHH
jgi:hypothetical protein